ncbi:hypothetical protein SLA2020_047790 [Shorea laevis]
MGQGFARAARALCCLNFWRANSFVFNVTAMGTPFERAEELKRKREEELDGACWDGSLQLLTLLQVISQLVGLWLRLARITASQQLHLLIKDLRS